MINIGTDEQNRSIIGYAKEIYVNTEAKILRLKIAKIWLDEDGSEFKREHTTLIFDQQTVHHYEDGGTDAEGDLIQTPVSQWDYWMGQVIPSGKTYEVLAGFIEANLVSEGYVSVEEVS